MRGCRRVRKKMGKEGKHEGETNRKGEQGRKWGKRGDMKRKLSENK